MNIRAALLLLCLVVPAAAQGPGTGILYASDYAKWTLVPNNQNVNCSTVTSGHVIQPIRAGRQLLVVDPNPALSEIVTVLTTATPGSCVLNAVLVNQHSSYALQSATGGLQEALDDAAQTGAVVMVTPGWTTVGGSTPMFATVAGNTKSSVVDQRTAVSTAYLWNGATYVAQIVGGGSVTKVANVSPDGTGNVPLTAASIGAIPTGSVLAANQIPNLDASKITTGTIVGSVLPPTVLQVNSADALFIQGGDASSGGQAAGTPTTGSVIVAPGGLMSLKYPDASAWTLAGIKSGTVTTSGSPATGTATAPTGTTFCVGVGATFTGISGTTASFSSPAAGTFTFYAFHL